jgi:hypothetical protein
MDNALVGYFKVRKNTPKTVVGISGFLRSNTSIRLQNVFIFSHVLVIGDINTSHRPIDVGDPDEEDVSIVHDVFTISDSKSLRMSG